MTKHHNFINRQAYYMVYSITQQYDKFGHLSIFTLLKHLMMLLKCNFSGLHFYTLLKTLIACRAMQLRYIKVETLLNNAFKNV